MPRRACADGSGMAGAVELPMLGSGAWPYLRPV